jgi:hypothetical protein
MLLVEWEVAQASKFNPSRPICDYDYVATYRLFDFCPLRYLHGISGDCKPCNSASVVHRLLQSTNLSSATDDAE